MSLFDRLRRPRSAAPTEPAPKHIEIWGHFVATHRFFKRLSAACVAFAFLALAHDAYTQMVALERPLVYFVDADGHATFAGARGEASAPLEVEVRYVAKRFLRFTMGFTSATVESDFAEAWNLMTAELQEQHNGELAEYAQERGFSFVEYIRQQNLRTVVEVDRLDITQHDDRTWSVRALGSARTWPLNTVGEEAEFQQKDWEATLLLVRVSRSELTPNGLLVAQRTMRFFAPKDEAQAQEDAVPTGSAEPQPTETTTVPTEVAP